MRRGGGCITLLIVLAALAGFGVLLWQNAAPAPMLAAVVPTQVEPTTAPNAWQLIQQAGFESSITPAPTVAIATQPFIAPTLPPAESQLSGPVAAGAVGGGAAPTFTPFSGAVTPTLPPTATPSPRAEDVTASPFDAQATIQVAQLQTRPPVSEWSDPPLIPPVNRDPLGRDHYWLMRPVDSNARNTTEGLAYYPYGSDGPENTLRIHHGIDIPNPVGENIRAAGDGVVVFASSPETPIFQSTSSYGNVVVIEHDFGYNGMPIFTVYAHLQAPLVSSGDRVAGGDIIGLNGNSGDASGPHVHFEVRIAADLASATYGSTYNPYLWLVPYVGHGVVVGRVLDSRGRQLQDLPVTLRNWGSGLVIASTTTYVFPDSPSRVNPDPIWDENFAFGDIPAGRYEVTTTIDGQRISRIVDVLEGRTTCVVLQLRDSQTPPPENADQC